MSVYLREFIEWAIGQPGRFLLDFIYQHRAISSLVFMCYGALLLYAKYIHTVYLPKKMSLLIKNTRATSSPITGSEISQLWQNQKARLPWYILVPSSYELWVQRASRRGDDTRLLAYNTKKVKMKESELLEQLIEAIKSN